MLCLQFDTLEQANQRNCEEATSRGCTGNKTDKWWGMFEQDGKVYLAVNNDAVREGETTVDVVMVVEGDGLNGNT